jgi:NADH:ubiquinone oxidoreductase subunit E
MASNYVCDRGGVCRPPYEPKSEAVKRAIAKVGYRPQFLIQLMEELQEEKGMLEHGVATFYSHFRLSKASRHAISVCTGTACHVKGKDAVIAAITKSLGVKPGEATPDGRFSFEAARCFGACALAPVVRIDGETFGNVKPEAVQKMLEKYK